MENYFNKHKLRLIHSIKKSGSLLEIGCGRGLLLKKLKRDYLVKGIDISRSAIKSASKFIEKNRLKVMNIEESQINGRYDVILAFDVLEHLKNPKRAIIKIRNSLKKEGVLILSVPNNYGFFGKIITSYFNFIDRTHTSTYEREKWISLLKENGFKIEEYNQSTFGISKRKFMKHLSFNLIVLCRK